MLKTKLILERIADKEFRLLERREQISKSFTINFLKFIYLKMTYADLANVRDISNTLRTLDRTDAFEEQTGLIAAGGGSSGYGEAIPSNLEHELIGIQLGTGTTAPTPTDYVMESRIAHGAGAGQLLYGGTELFGLAFADPNGQFTIRRYFTNGSGGPITVNEVGIYASGKLTAAPTIVAFLIARDKVAPGVAVADGEILRVTYVPQITV